MTTPSTAPTGSVPNGSAANTPPPAIALENISKRFGPVKANDAVTLSVPAGSIHGIVGENGAGKSTLMSILYGFYQADSGDISVAGNKVTINNSQQAIALGIGMVHQHFMLVDNFSVLENVILGAEGGGLLAQGMQQARQSLSDLARDYGLDVDPDALIHDLPVGAQQRVEILKALYRGARILILDEPTGVLTPQETEGLFRIFRRLREQGVTVVMITHKLREIMDVTDNVSVMRQGRMVAHRVTAETSREELAELMVGRKVLLRVDKQAAKIKATEAPVLSVQQLGVIDDQGVTRLDKVSLEVRAGEIVGIAGVAGNGQSELLEVIAGIRAPDHGRVQVSGQDLFADRHVTARDIRKRGVAHVPEDRLRAGLVRSFAARESFILGYDDDPRYCGWLLMKQQEITQDCAEKMETFDVRPDNPELKTANFSGGNQQKLVLAREMEREPALLIVGQPTRGVDIGAIEFIHRQLVDLRDRGCAILLVSVELEEVMSLADRILVMFEGGIVGAIPAAEANERDLGLMMANAHQSGPTANNAAAAQQAPVA